MTVPEPELSSATGNTRTRLIEAAITCFAEKGYDATGIREIAKLANANSALVQYHFGGKEGLYLETLRHIFLAHPPVQVRLPADPAAPGARAEAIQAIRDLIRAMTEEFMRCSAGPLERASMFLVTRELQAPRAEVLSLVIDHVGPYIRQMDTCLGILLPGLGKGRMQDFAMSIFGQIFHMHNNLPMVRIIREEPDFPTDIQALADHFADFSLRGLGIPEAFPTLGA
jgi:AcrR family transcriptional regulator